MSHAETINTLAPALFRAGVNGRKELGYFFSMPKACDLEHEPVMRDEVLDALRVKTDGIYVDGTYGRGGHAQGVVERLGQHGHLLILDRDPQAIAVAQRHYAADPRVEIAHHCFGDLASPVRARGWDGHVDGIVLDLGVSSPQLDDPSRGFSFRADGPLDMRMDPGVGISAAAWLAQAAEEDIADVLWRFGEERFSRRIARAIVSARESCPLTRTGELAALIAAAVPSRERHKDPATRSFQALRLFVNDELGELERGLMSALAVLAPGGRLVVLSFHSLEDRIVKRFMRDHARGVQLPVGVPVTGHGRSGVSLHIVAKARKATPEEVAGNPRARSAVLRVAERLAR